MAYDGNGNYVVPAGTAALAGAIIDATPYNALLTDLQTALSKALLRDGQSAALANIPLGGFKLTGIGAGLANGEAVRFEQLYALPKAVFTPLQVVPFAGTLSIDASLSNVFEIGALTANVTSFTILNPALGQTLNIRFIQDGTGSRTIALPAGSLVAGAPDPTPTKTSWLFLIYSAYFTRWEGVWNSLP